MITCTFLLMLLSCKKYLDQKPNLQLVVPSTLADCQALLDDYNTMNTNYPDHGEVSADNYYFTDATFNSLASSPEDQDAYIWAATGQHTNQYLNCYKVIYSANLVLQVLEKFSDSDPNYNTLKGSALFFRAYSTFQVAQLFAKPYNAGTANTDLGIPLRSSPNLDEKSKRGTLQETYNRILEDLINASSLLPTSSSIPTRPNKAAAYAALSRTYLAMEDYNNAAKMASECLKLYNALINYNLSSDVPTINTVGSAPTGPTFTRFNSEVIFHSVTISGSLSQSQAKIDPLLYDSYSIDDNRKTVFFQANEADEIGTFAFRGSYDGSTTSQLFNGISTNEVYLCRAESLARTGNVNAAMDDLNTLLRNRYVNTPSNPFIDRTATNAIDALDQILAERRKELIFRGLRWMDLRRLNRDSRYSKTLRRNLNTFKYTPLQPNDLRYAMLIPLQVINTSGIQQNER